MIWRLVLLVLKMPAERTRMGEGFRQTKETNISVAIDLERADPISISTGIGYFDHMLEQIARHGGFSLLLTCEAI